MLYNRPMPPAMLGAWQAQPCWACVLTSLKKCNKTTKMRLMCVVKVFFTASIDQCAFLFLSQKHINNWWWCIWEVCLEISLVSGVFGYHFWNATVSNTISVSTPLVTVLIHDFCCFKHKLGFVTFDPPCDMILLKTPLLPDGKGQTNDADASEKFVCPNNRWNRLKTSVLDF